MSGTDSRLSARFQSRVAILLGGYQPSFVVAELFYVVSIAGGDSVGGLPRSILILFAPLYTIIGACWMFGCAIRGNYG